jgi:hypothetical protein
LFSFIFDGEKINASVGAGRRRSKREIGRKGRVKGMRGDS